MARPFPCLQKVGSVNYVVDIYITWNREHTFHISTLKRGETQQRRMDDISQPKQVWRRMKRKISQEESRGQWLPRISRQRDIRKEIYT